MTNLRGSNVIPGGLPSGALPQRPFCTRVRSILRGLSVFLVVVALTESRAVSQTFSTKKGPSSPSKKGDVKRKEKDIGYTPTPEKNDLQVIQNLQRKVTVSWKSIRLADALSELEKGAKIPIVLDEKSIAKARLSADSPVSADLKDKPVGSVLNAILTKPDLDYLVEGGKLIVVSHQDAVGKTFERTYILKDIAKNAKEGRALIAEMLKITRAREEWGDAGGFGTLDFDEKKLELRIRHTFSDHTRIEWFLSGRSL